MKNIFYFKIVVLSIILVSSFSTAAQKTLVTDTKTDQTYANTTQVFKSEKATDSQVLAEIDGNFGIGDVVRIAVAPPKPKTVPPPPAAAPNPTVNSKTPNLAVVATPTQQTTMTVNSAPNVVKTAEPQGITTPSEQKVTLTNIENTPSRVSRDVPSVNEVNQEDKITERASTQNKREHMERSSTKSEKSSNSVKRSSGKSSRKSSFSLFSNWSFKSTKFKGGSKFGCYRF